MVRALSFVSGFALLAAVPIGPGNQSRISEVAKALAAGDAAAIAHNPRRLMLAAAALAEHGAHPVAATSGNDPSGAARDGDKAVEWGHLAVQWGAQPYRVLPWRGRMTGPGYRFLQLAPHARFQTRQVFMGGQSARVELVTLAQGLARLSVVVAGPSPRCFREARRGILVCAWRPVYSEPHEITVENDGATAARYYLVTS